MKPEEQARRARIAATAQQPPSQHVQMVGSLRLHVASQITILPQSPLDGGAQAQYGELELHLATLGSGELQILPLLLPGAEELHNKLGQAIERVKRNRAGDGLLRNAGEPDPRMDPDELDAPAGDIENDGDGTLEA